MPASDSTTQFHRRGLHVQKAHGRWSVFAADGSHLQGAMIALMPTAEDAKRLAFKGGEKAEDLHVTLFFVGDDAEGWGEQQRGELISNVRGLATEMEGPVTGKIFGIAHWNAGSDTASWVWSVGDAERGGRSLALAHTLATEALESLHDHPEIPLQHSPWVPHICAAYTGDLTLAKELEKRLGEVTFDRIRISFGDEDTDIPLQAPETITAAALLLRRDPRPFEADVDFVAHQVAWQIGVDEVIDSLSGQLDRWYGEIARQVETIMDSGDVGRLRTIKVSTDDLADQMFGQMMKLAQEAGEAVEREAAGQGVKVKKWTLTGHREKLMRRTADAMAGIMGDGLVLSARRHALSYAGSGASGAEVAREVREHLDSLTESRPREAVGAALTAAQNTGRRAVLEASPPARYYASEILDNRTCAPCKKLDGDEFPSLDAAYKAYPTGGYRRCLGGGRCRGMVVARWEADEPEVEVISDADGAEAVVAHGSLGDPDYHTKHPGNRGKGLRQNGRGAMLGSPDYTEEEHIASLGYYTGEGSLEFNSFLRDGSLPRGGTAQDAKDQSRALADLIQIQEPLSEPQTLFRGGPDLDLKPGDEITDRGFVSSSESEGIADAFALGYKIRGQGPGQTYTVTIPAGAQALSVWTVDPGMDNEDEWILPPGTRFRAISPTELEVII